MDILQKVAQMKQNFMQSVLVSPKNYFNQYQTVLLIELYTHSKFKNLSPEEAEARGITFLNITNQALRTAVRKTNLDEKSVTLSLADTLTSYLALVADIEFKDDEEFGKKLNEMVLQYFKFGTIVTVVDKNKPKWERVQVIPFNKVMWNQNDYTVAPIVFVDKAELSTVLNNGDLMLDRVREFLDKNEKDINDYEPVGVYNVYYKYNGVQKYAIVVDIEGNQFKVYDAVTSARIFVERRNQVYNRSMGQGVVEELFEAQKNVNEGANLLIEDLRAAAKNVFVTDDEELDGMDLSELTNLTVIKTERNRELRQLYKTTSSFGALQSYILQWVGASKEQSQATNAALGVSEGSREAVGVRGFKLQEVEGNYAFEKERIGLFIRHMYKQAILEIVYEYFGSYKKINDLLTKEQKHSFYTYISEKLSGDYAALLYIDTLEDVDSEAVKETLYEMLQSGKVADIVDFDSVFMSKNDFIDKVRVDVVGEQIDKAARLSALNLIAQQMMTNPQAYADSNFTIEDVTEKIVELTGGSDSLVELFNQMKSAKINADGVTSINDPYRYERQTN